MFNYLTNQQPFTNGVSPSQSGDYIYVPSFDAAYNYPVLPGCTVKFINTVEPFEYTKTVMYGTNELIFKIFKLEDVTDQYSAATPRQNSKQPNQNGSKNDELTDLKQDMDDLKKLVTSLAESINDRNRGKNYYNNKKEEKSE